MKFMHNIRKMIAIFVMGTLLLLSYQTSWASYTFGECSRIEENGLRDELNRICQQTFASETSRLDIHDLVNNEWRNANMDGLIDDEIDKAVHQVQQDAKWTDKMWSSVSTDKAKEYAEKVAAAAFGSDRFKKAIENISEAIGKDISQKLESAVDQSASSGFMCLREFIEKEYSKSIVDVFEDEIAQTTKDIKVPTSYSDPSYVRTHTKALAGLGVIIGTQIARKISQRISRRIATQISGRIAGRIASRLVPFIGWGLLVWDIYDSSQGAFPQIQMQLKESGVKEQIKDEIATSVREQLTDDTHGIAEEISNELFSKWSEFKRNHERVLDLSQRYDDFKPILDKHKHELYKLGKLVEIIIRKYNEDELMHSVSNGTFNKIMNAPESAFNIIEVTESVSDVGGWMDLSGRRIDKVVEFEIYKHKSPKDFNSSLLERLIEVNDKKTISTLVLLDNNVMEDLLKISSEHLKTISKNLTSDDMTQLSWYLSRFDQPVINVLVSRLVDKPSSSMEKIKQESVKQYVMDSKNKEQVLTFILSDADYFHLWGDSLKLVSGDVSSDLFFYKYSIGKVFVFFTILIIVLFILITVIRRSIFPFRR